MIMQGRKEQLFGVVKEGDTKPNYQGTETDTIIITVDNDEKTIQADLKLYNILGVTGDKAFPGNLGLENRQIALDSRDIARQAKEKVSEFEKTYASKKYVQEEISKSTTLSKQIVDSVDLLNNKIIVGGISKDPQDGILYLVADNSSEEETNYKQYTTIEGQLTLIGNTAINLDDYATLQYVDDKLDQLDLTPYATTDFVEDELEKVKAEIPDVSEFITAIPEEYTTEQEVQATLSEYATKTYVQAELSKVGTLSKEVIQGVDVANNKVIINGVEQDPQPDIIYLVLDSADSNVYQQYTLIDGKLTNIGSTDVDLTGYATKEYVDEELSKLDRKLNSTKTELRTDFENLLLNIKFIDGGNAPII